MSDTLREAAQDALTEMARCLYSDDGLNRTRMEMAHDDLVAALAAPPPGLDVERLARALVTEWPYEEEAGYFAEKARHIAREYAALGESDE